MNKLTIRDIEVTNKKVLVRVDFNVPQDKNGAITDDSRIKATLPTIQYLIEHKARIILCSHLGRPGGKVVDDFRLTVAAQRLSQILGQQVGVTKDCIGPEVKKSVDSLKPGHALLLENLRFHPEEEANDPNFAKALASLADIYVNDAFGASHRAHASVVGVTKFLPSVAGFLLEKEIDTLGSLLENPAHPFGGLFGGAKVSDKVGMLEKIMHGKVDILLIGGGMAATFLKAKSYNVGKSLIEADRIDTAASLIAAATGNGVRMYLPTDVVVSEEIKADAKSRVVAVEQIGDNDRIVDIGPQTIKNFTEKLQTCKTVFWNGPMGIYEIPPFAKGTDAMAKVLAGIKASTIVGGGSTAEIVTAMGFADKMTFVSTGGGASLEFLGGKPLPGAESLLDKNSPTAQKIKKHAIAK